MTEPSPTQGRDAPDLVAFPPLMALIAVVLAVALEWIAPLGLLPPPFAPSTTILGAVLALGAGTLAASAVITFRLAGTHVNPGKPALKVVDHGPFRLTRNPMYVSLVVLSLGIGLIFSLDWSIPIAPILWAALHYGVVLREEAYLSAKFGEPYDAYRARTRRWL